MFKFRRRGPLTVPEPTLSIPAEEDFRMVWKYTGLSPARGRRREFAMHLAVMVYDARAAGRAEGRAEALAELSRSAAQ